MVIETLPAGRAALRDHLLSEVTRALEGRAQTLEGGPLDGIAVVSLGHVNEAIAEVALAELPDVDDQTAEVRAPAKVTVVTPCPRCGISQDMDVEIDRTLLVDPGVSHLKLKAKSAQRVHVCGQQTLSAHRDGAVEGQERFELADILEPGGEPTEDSVEELGSTDALPEECPFPGCHRPADHRGKHDVSAVDDDDSSSDLLP